MLTSVYWPSGMCQVNHVIIEPFPCDETTELLPHLPPYITHAATLPLQDNPQTLLATHQSCITSSLTFGNITLYSAAVLRAYTFGALCELL